MRKPSRAAWLKPSASASPAKLPPEMTMSNLVSSELVKAALPRRLRFLTVYLFCRPMGAE